MSYAKALEEAVHAACAIYQIVLIYVAAIDVQGLELCEPWSARFRHHHRVPGDPLRPALRNEFAGVRIDRQTDAEGYLRIGIVGRAHGERHQVVHLAVLDLRCSVEISAPFLDRAACSCERSQKPRKLRKVAKLECHISGVARRPTPEIGMEQRVSDRTVPAGTLSENAAPAVTATMETTLHERHRFFQQKVCPAACSRAVDVLIAAEPGKAVRERNDGGRHGARADQAIEPLGNIFGK